jgi:hypothetical protein
VSMDKPLRVLFHKTHLEVYSPHWSLPSKYRLMQHDPRSNQLAVLFPGNAYTLDAPALWYIARAVFQSGCDVLGAEYGFQANRQFGSLTETVVEVAEALRQFPLHQYEQIVFIGKSLGTIVQGEVAKQLNLAVRRNVFLTPVQQAIPFIRNSEYSLVVIGDQDHLFRRPEQQEVESMENVELHILPGANHSLEVENDYRKSMDYLIQTVDLVASFCKRHKT